MDVDVIDERVVLCDIFVFFSFFLVLSHFVSAYHLQMIKGSDFGIGLLNLNDSVPHVFRL